MDAGDMIVDAISKLPQYKEGTSRDIRLTYTKYPKGYVFPVVSIRQWMFEGLKPCNVKFDTAYKVWQLKEKSGLWMSTLPQELYQMAQITEKLYGRVLIGGLGLGVVAVLATHNKAVNEITVVDNNKDVIKLIKKYLPKRIRVIQEDLFNVMKDKGNVFDTAFFDIWQATGEWSWRKFIVPLRRLGYNFILGDIFCWQEEEMNGQVREALYRFASFDPSQMVNLVENFHYWVFKMGVMKEFPDVSVNKESGFKDVWEIGEKNKDNVVLNKLIDKYLNEVGSPEWEDRWGYLWDNSKTK